MTRNTSFGAWAFLAWVCFSPVFLGAQENLLDQLSEQEAENTAEAESYIQELLSHPLEINHARREELRRLPFVAPEQIRALLRHRQKYGDFKNLEAALAVLAVTGDTLALCREIFFLDAPRPLAWQNVSARWRITRPASSEDKWLGPPYRSYERVQLATAALAFGVLAERDPGEPRWDDHRIFYGQWQHENRWKVIGGYYQIEWAQGLALWSPYGAALSADVHAASRQDGRGVLSYLSGDENAGLRGGAVVWQTPAVSLFSFVSARRLDVTLRDSVAVGLDESGYHRTATELARRQTTGEQLAGAAIKVNWKNKIAAGVLGYREVYDKRWGRPTPGAGYFDFTGRRNEVFSLFVSATTAALQTDIELARGRSGGMAGSAVLSGEAARLQWTLEGHYYARDFHSPHGRAFNAIADVPQNELGYSLGLGSRLRRGMRAEIFVAQHQDLWRPANLPLPGAQLLAGAKWDWQIRRDLLLQCRWQHNRHDELLRTAGVLIAPETRRSGRAKIQYQASAKWRFTARLDFAKRLQLPNNSTKRGLALSQEVQWWLQPRLLLASRYTFFEAPSSAPLYQYEQDLPGVFTSFALRERGRRAYIYVRYLSTLGFELSIKMAGMEKERSIFAHSRSWTWGAQIDWRLR